MVYQWKDGARFSASAEKIGQELSQLGDAVQPASVVKKARNKKSELHKCFQWDDTKAAEEYRLVQAREVMRSITVVVEDMTTEDEKPMTVRLYEHVHIESEVPNRKRQSVYVPTMKVLETPDLRQQIEDRLKNDIWEAERTAEKYQYLSEAFGETRKRLHAARMALVN